MTLRFALRVLATLALATAAAFTWRALDLPLPWMLGPLLATAAASLAGAPTQSSTPLRNTSQWVIGTALGLYFTPEVTALVLRLWWAVVLAVAWSLALGWAFGHGLHRRVAGRLGGTERGRRATTYFAGAIGGASEMTLLAERNDARTDLVAAAHSLRMVIVTVGIPFAFTFSGLHGVDVAPSLVREVAWGPLAVLGAATLAGALALARVGWSNPWFIGALGVSMALAMAGVQLSALPTWATNAAQLILGVSLGVRFRSEFIHTAPRWLADVAVGTVAMIVACAAFGAALAWATGLHPATLVLGTAPGGITEMAITAKVLQLGVPVVTAFQVCRLVAVLLLVAPMYRLLYGRVGEAGEGSEGDR